jgi:hypothetical protein
MEFFRVFALKNSIYLFQRENSIYFLKKKKFLFVKPLTFLLFILRVILYTTYAVY